MSDNDDIPQVRFNEIEARLEIEYPCRWLYKVIGADADAMRVAILEIIEAEEVRVEPSNTSSGGRFVSLNVEVTVRSESERTGYYEQLRASDAIRMVL